MNKRGVRILGIVLAVLVITVAVIILSMRKELNSYHQGFPQKGTYVYPDSISMENVDSSLITYIVLSGDMEDGKAFIHQYQPSKQLFAGVYAKTEYPNLYHITMPDSTLDTCFILVDKDSLIVIGNDEAIRYRKVTYGLMYSDVDVPEPGYL